MRQVHRVLTIVVLGLGVQAATASSMVPEARLDGMQRCQPGYTPAVYRQDVAIPDSESEGVTIGPLASRGAGVLEDVIVAITVDHPYAGELMFSIGYDADRDGRPDAVCPIEMHLARQDPCADRAAWACPIELDGTYFFKDDGWREMGESSTFDVFTGLGAGGDWYLSIVDHEAGNAGAVSNWSVYTQVSVQSASGGMSYMRACAAGDSCQ